jgi:hypothetical protein
MTKIVILVATVFALTMQPQASAQQALQEKFAMVKQGVAQNQAALRQYVWTEETNILLNGEVKKTTYNRCQYGPDGAVQKTLINSSSPPAEKRGVRGRVVERKKEELGDYMQQASALVKQYVPPNPEQMESAFRAGGASLGQPGPGTLQLQFKNYVKPGDSLVFTFNTAAKALIRIEVNTYMSDQKDAVKLQVNFQTLPGGPNYVAQTVLDAPAKKIQVQTTSSSYQRLGP